MTPIETELIQNLGNSNLQLVVTVFIAVLFYGMFVVLFSASVIIFTRRGFSNRATSAMFVATAINFLVSTVVTGIQVTIFIRAIREALIIDMDYPLSEKLELVTKVVWNFDIVVDWAGTISLVLSDLIVIWRAWALFPDKRCVILPPFILWIGLLGTSVACCAWALTPIGPMALTTSRLITVLSTTTMALSIATNAITTSLIAWRLWSYRTFIIKTLGLRGRTSPVQTILLLLVESGLVYLGIQIGIFRSAPDSKVLNHHAAAFRAARLSAIYPTVVVVLVETQLSMVDLCEVGPSNANKSVDSIAALGPISSAAPHVAEPRWAGTRWKNMAGEDVSISEGHTFNSIESADQPPGRV